MQAEKTSQKLKNGKAMRKTTCRLITKPKEPLKCPCHETRAGQPATRKRNRIKRERTRKKDHTLVLFLLFVALPRGAGGRGAGSAAVVERVIRVERLGCPCCCPCRDSSPVASASAPAPATVPAPGPGLAAAARLRRLRAGPAALSPLFVVVFSLADLGRWLQNGSGGSGGSATAVVVVVKFGRSGALERRCGLLWLFGHVRSRDHRGWVSLIWRLLAGGPFCLVFASGSSGAFGFRLGPGSRGGAGFRGPRSDRGHGRGSAERGTRDGNRARVGDGGSDRGRRRGPAERRACGECARWGGRMCRSDRGHGCGSAENDVSRRRSGTGYGTHSRRVGPRGRRIVEWTDACGRVRRAEATNAGSATRRRARRSSIQPRQIRVGRDGLALRDPQLLRALVVQLQAPLALRQGHDPVVARRAGDYVRREALHGAPARRLQAEEGNGGMHRVLFRAIAADRITREVLHREWHAESACAHAGLRDKRGTLGGALRGGRVFDRLELRYLQRVRGDGLAQIGPNGRMVPSVEAKRTRDLEAAERLGQLGDQSEGRQHDAHLMDCSRSRMFSSLVI
ncbi:hypothetical protein F5148DRAFT_570246 [Russula earlei]|uniref:Uncharacterized protein n=1 Tax=Russula earlei TaxID=71964 RepID=A0ACC0UFT9_9AGAM|nr:hypothetical protein F5148DRAFT_570246 [Russula earlei]